MSLFIFLLSVCPVIWDDDDWYYHSSFSLRRVFLLLSSKDKISYPVTQGT